MDNGYFDSELLNPDWEDCPKTGKPGIPSVERVPV